MPGRFAHLRREVVNLKRRHRSEPFPPDIRARVVNAAFVLLADGLTRQATAEAVGVSTTCLGNWLRYCEEQANSVRMVPVEVETPVGGPALIAVAPNGWRFEGLDVHSAAALVRALE